MPGTILQRDITGPEVKKLQLLLNSALIPPPHLALDGFFGAGTQEAVMRFQRIHHLTPDGVVGPSTWEALGQRGITVLSDIVHICVADAPWLEIAALELGVHEDARPGKSTQRILEYHRTTSLKASTDEIPWCSSFVNWVMAQVGHTGTNSALAKSWLRGGIESRHPGLELSP